MRRRLLSSPTLPWRTPLSLSLSNSCRTCAICSKSRSKRSQKSSAKSVATLKWSVPISKLHVPLHKAWRSRSKGRAIRKITRWSPGARSKTWHWLNLTHLSNSRSSSTRKAGRSLSAAVLSSRSSLFSNKKSEIKTSSSEKNRRRQRLFRNVFLH